MASVEIRLDSAAIRSQLTGPNGAVARDLHRRANRVLNEARYLCPVDTGNLRGSITWEIRKRGNQLVGVVGTNVPYAIYVEKGTRYMRPQPFLVDALPAASF